MMDLILPGIGLAGRHLVPTTYGRTALYGALRALSVEGGEVALPAFTCKNTVVDAVVQAGAKPVFVEVELPTLNMDLGDLALKLGPQVKAVVSHHYYGCTSTNLTELTRLCRERGIPHVEDCAHSLGASYNGVPVGTIGDVAVYSFTKGMVTAAGGCIVTDKPEIAGRLEALFGGVRIGINEFYKTYYARRHRLELAEDLLGESAGRLPLLALQVLGLLGRTIFGFDPREVRGLFYHLRDETVPDRAAEIDIRMSEAQSRIIRRDLRTYESTVAAKRTLFERIRSVLPHAIPVDGMEATYGNFVVASDDLPALRARAAESGVRLRDPWPVFQPYWHAQRTLNVDWIASHLTLIHLGEHLQGEAREHLEHFLREY